MNPSIDLRPYAVRMPADLHAQTSRIRRLWNEYVDRRLLVTSVLIAVVLAIPLIGFGLAKAVISDLLWDDSDPIMDEISSRDIWVTRPKMFPSAVKLDSETVQIDKTLSGPDLTVVTPDTLVRKAVQYEGKNIFLVGKVASSVRLPGSIEEIALATDANHLAFIRRDAIERSGLMLLRRGDVVYALGRVAATGRAQDAKGKEHLAAYFLSSDVQVYYVPFDIASNKLEAALDRLIRIAGWDRSTDG